LNLLGPDAAHRLHAIHPAMPGHEAAATAFALAMIQAFSAQDLPGQASSGPSGLSRAPLRPLLWVQAETASTESGSPSAPGLAALGVDPAGLVVVRAANALATLAAAEMGLEEAGLAGIIVELPVRLPADMLKPGKRLSLRASQTRTPCLLLHATATPVEMPVASRWTVRSRTPLAGRAAAMPDFTSAFDLQLTKNRFGPLGRWSLAWQSEPAGPPDLAPLAQPNLHDRSDHPRFIFAPLPPLPEPVAAASADRPPGASRRAQPRPQRDTAA
jgi:protein ImuA